MGVGGLLQRKQVPTTDLEWPEEERLNEDIFGQQYASEGREGCLSLAGPL